MELDIYISLDFADLFERPVTVEIPNKEQGDFYYYRYHSSTVNCDVCEGGHSFGIKTNISHLQRISNWTELPLHKLSFEPKKWCEEIAIPWMYVTKDKEVILKLYDLYCKLGTLACLKCVEWSDDTNKFYNSQTGLTSVFMTEDCWPEPMKREAVGTVDYTQICCSCYQWFTKVLGNDGNSFTEMCPITITKKNFLEEIADDTETFKFKSEEDRQYVKKISQLL